MPSLRGDWGGAFFVRRATEPVRSAVGFGEDRVGLAARVEAEDAADEEANEAREAEHRRRCEGEEAGDLDVVGAGADEDGSGETRHHAEAEKPRSDLEDSLSAIGIVSRGRRGRRGHADRRGVGVVRRDAAIPAFSVGGEVQSRSGEAKGLLGEELLPLYLNGKVPVSLLDEGGLSELGREDALGLGEGAIGHLAELGSVLVDEGGGGLAETETGMLACLAEVGAPLGGDAGALRFGFEGREDALAELGALAERAGDAGALVLREGAEGVADAVNRRVDLVHRGPHAVLHGGVDAGLGREIAKRCGDEGAAQRGAKEGVGGGEAGIFRDRVGDAGEEGVQRAVRGDGVEAAIEAFEETVDVQRREILGSGQRAREVRGRRGGRRRGAHPAEHIPGRRDVVWSPGGARREAPRCRVEPRWSAEGGGTETR